MLRLDPVLAELPVLHVSSETVERLDPEPTELRDWLVRLDHVTLEIVSQLDLELTSLAELALDGVRALDPLEPDAVDHVLPLDPVEPVLSLDDWVEPDTELTEDGEVAVEGSDPELALVPVLEVLALEPEPTLTLDRELGEEALAGDCEDTDPRTNSSSLERLERLPEVAVLPDEPVLNVWGVLALEG